MNKDEIYLLLEMDFEKTFIGELIPGILHNFANPLNGIMGRAKLMQRRIEDGIRKMEENYPEAAAGMKDEIQRIKTDVRAVGQESEYFFNMFKDVAGKFYTLASRNNDRINLSQLLAAEMRFADFYLDFKHEIKKKMEWDGDTPDFRTSAANLSLAFWMVIRFAMTKAKGSNKHKEFYIKTAHDQTDIKVLIQYTGEAIPSDFAMLMNNLQSGSCLELSGIDRGLLLSLLLLDQCQAKISVWNEQDKCAVSLDFPYRSRRAEKQ